MLGDEQRLEAAVAIARDFGIDFTIDDFERISARTPTSKRSAGSGSSTAAVAFDEPITIRIQLQFFAEVTNPILGFLLRDRLGVEDPGRQHCGEGREQEERSQAFHCL